MFFLSYFFFFNDTATTEIYTLSLHDALPISRGARWAHPSPFPGWFPTHHTGPQGRRGGGPPWRPPLPKPPRSEEHTSELQSRPHLVCRLLLEKKKKLENILQNISNTLRRDTR